MTWSQFYLSSMLGALSSGYAESSLDYVTSPCLIRLSSQLTTLENTTSLIGELKATDCHNRLLDWTSVPTSGTIGTLNLVTSGEDVYLQLGNRYDAIFLISTTVVVRCLGGLLIEGV